MKRSLVAGLVLVASVMGWVVSIRPARDQQPEKPLAKSGATPVGVMPRPSPSRTADSVKQAPMADKPKQRPRPAGKLVLDPAARNALKLVGSDSAAERYWLGAINNPLLPPGERKDLIEDLNEDGLSDPRHPGLIDLPLIAARIRLLEQLMPDALDQVNADAFQEAHKDLVTLYAKLTQQ